MNPLNFAHGDHDHLPLDQLQRLPRNPKDHDNGLIHESFGEFGFVGSIVVNVRTGRLIGGHGRTNSLQQWKMTGKKPPRGIVVKDKVWYVPTDFVDIPEEEEEKLAIVLNRAQERGGWHGGLLTDCLADLAAREKAGTGSLTGSGFDGDDVDAMIRANARLADSIKPYEPSIPVSSPEGSFLDSLVSGGDADDADPARTDEPTVPEFSPEATPDVDTSGWVALRFSLPADRRDAIVKILKEIQSENGLETPIDALCFVLEIP